MEVALTRTLEVRRFYSWSTLQGFLQLVVDAHRLPFQLLSQVVDAETQPCFGSCF